MRPFMLLMVTVASVSLSKAAFAQDCALVNARSELVEELVTSSGSRSAVSEARKIARDFDQCAEAHLTLATALNARLDDVGGMSALSVSREYRKAIQAALKVAPNNIDARTEQIGYLIHAPGIAGGNRKKARRQIAELELIAPLEAAQMALGLARAENDSENVMAHLGRVLKLQPGAHALRSELCRRHIVRGEYNEAFICIEQWPEERGDLPWVALERLYLGAAARVYAESNLDEAEDRLIQFIQLRPTTNHERLSSVAQAYALLGTAYEGQAKHDPARQAYQDALSRDQTNTRAIEGFERVSNSQGSDH